MLEEPDVAHEPGCPACRIAVAQGASGRSTVPSADVRRGISQGKGNQLKLLLLMHAWFGTPHYSDVLEYFRGEEEQLPAATTFSRAWLQTEAGMNVVSSNLEAANDEPGETGSRNVSYALRRLEADGLVTVVHMAGKGHPNAYSLHGFSGRKFLVPGRLFTGGWLSKLGGPSLLLLLLLLACQRAPLGDHRRWRRTPDDLPDLAERGRMLLERSVLQRLPFSENINRQALEELKSEHLVAEALLMRKWFLVLLNPDLRPPPSRHR